MVELTPEKIKRAIEEKRCPYCQGTHFQGVYPRAYQEFYTMKDGEIEREPIETDAEFTTVVCVDCGKIVSQEIVEKWFPTI